MNTTLYINILKTIIFKQKKKKKKKKKRDPKNFRFKMVPKGAISFSRHFDLCKIKKRKKKKKKKKTAKGVNLATYE